MFHYKNRILKLLIGLMLFLSCSAFANMQMKNVSENASFLFTWNAHSGILVPVTPKEGVYKLTLKDLGSTVFYFSDRPNRIIGNMSPENFLKLWQQNVSGDFKSVAPNVDIKCVKLYGLFSEKISNFVVELSNPVYNKHHHTITYDAKLLPKVAGHYPKKNVKLEDLQLFFDNVTYCPSCNGPPV